MKKIVDLNIDINVKNKDGLIVLYKVVMIFKDDIILKYLLFIGVKKDIIIEFDESVYILVKENEFFFKNNVLLDFLK